jgi:hypothetical protein
MTGQWTQALDQYQKQERLDIGRRSLERAFQVIENTKYRVVTGAAVVISIPNLVP